MFDDNILESKGSWTDILEHCTQNRVYPTVILYEKLDQNEEKPDSLNYNLPSHKLVDLLRDSNR